MTPEEEYQHQIAYYQNKLAEAVQVQALMHVEIQKLKSAATPKRQAKTAKAK